MNSNAFQKRIEPVSIILKDGTPYSSRFEDVYYSPVSGIDESTYVYLEGSGFIEALLKNQDQKEFIIGEIGFGVGLNFLLTYRHFMENSKPDQRLVYVSIEKHPVRHESLKSLYETLPSLKNYSDVLLQNYPVLTPGFHPLVFEDGKVRLILLLGDAPDMIEKLQRVASKKIQFWYWDGFAPSKNPDAFQGNLFQELIPVTAPGATASSFTSAGWVRRGLQEAGFEIIKRKGFAHKRESIQAKFPTQSEWIDKKPWFSSGSLRTLEPGDSVAVIGAGLSGTAIARALAERGFSVNLVDQDSIASKASGNSTGMFNVQLSKRPNPISRFSQLSLIHFLREIEKLKLKTKRGILRLDAIREKEDFFSAMETSEYPSDFYRMEDQGMIFPQCGIVNPKILCETRAEHSRIRFIRARIQQVKRTSSGFELFDDSGTSMLNCAHVVYATGASLLEDSTLEHPLLNQIPLRSIRGQVIHVHPTEASANLNFSLVDSGYITPLAPEISGTRTHCIGATYQAKQILPDQEQRDTADLLEEARKKHPAFEALQPEKVASWRVGYRLSTPDKLPLIGPLFDPEKMKHAFQKSIRSGKILGKEHLDSEPGEWIFLGMGSRGITFSSYGAEILASLMCGEILPIEGDLWEHLHSARFIVRNLKKPEAP